MKKISLLSDTHGYFDPKLASYLKGSDEIWHAGDFGDQQVVDALEAIAPLRGVFGNIDGQAIRTRFPEDHIFNCEQVKVYMTHIGGYPPKYNARTRPVLVREQPQLFICGHSHILKIQFDESLQCLHINPGAAGKQGWHKVRTLVRFEIDGTDIRHAEVVEMPR